jgi:hypothetical protein
MSAQAPYAIVAATLLLNIFANGARADDCSALNGVNYSQGQLFALIKK